MVFPEGTTFAGDEVRPFHAGAFVAAARANAEVIPVGLAYATGSEAAFVNETFVAHLGRVAAAEPSDLAVCVGEPIVAAGAKAADVRDAAHAAVQRLVDEARTHVDEDAELTARPDRRGSLPSSRTRARSAS
jgi:1-acyl-sn-glycerol-3-phosphate acyltransferase